MSERPDEIAGVLVTGRGTLRSTVARVAGGQVLGVVGAVAGGAAAARKQDASGPLSVGQLAYLSVTPDAVTVYAAKRGLVRKARPSDNVIASMSRTTVERAQLEKRKMSGALELAFGDGSAWAFDVPRHDFKPAARVVDTLQRSGA